MKRGGPIARVSRKRRKLNAVADKWRAAFVRTVGQCELCNRNYSLACHEIASGNGIRPKALMEPCAILVLCNAPHGIKASCHSVVQKWERSKQLALLLLRRGGDYDIDRYHEIVGQNAPDQSDVDGWLRNLKTFVTSEANWSDQ